MNQQQEFKGNNRLLIGIVLSVLTFWLFATSLVNVIPTLTQAFHSRLETISIAVSLTALFCGMFVVGAGGLADTYGRVKLTNIGLWLNIIGSLLVIATSFVPLLLIGRAIQGLSAAAIMPATLAIVKTYYHGKDRQRALSFWSIGSWGGSGLASIFGGVMTTFLGWKYIFIFSIIASLIALLLIKGTPETTAYQGKEKKRFDVIGVGLLVLIMLSINIIITQGSKMGWLSIFIICLICFFITMAIIFYYFERKSSYPLIDFNLFNNRLYSVATLANFLLNTVAGTLIVANTFVQQDLGFSAFKAGMLSITYLVAVLSMIRVGEMFLRKVGPRQPMLLGTFSTMLGVLFMSMTMLSVTSYIVVCVLGYLLFGLGLGLFATPSTDTAISNCSESEVGVAAGIYKMASSLGGAFGITLAGTIYSVMASTSSIATGAMISFWFNALMALSSFLVVCVALPKLSRRSK
ncbi:MFS transporter [Staphylococcus warneri]|uniref:MFS transporter n=1 Tax=Staphylococcus TaxID=1279 RepID=UPI000640647F|nr:MULTISPECIES: MFS transporter [Staphylococcus]MCG7305872.1 MFS transporter [Staphylococcus warneri]PNN63515.1 MFS transporter [Staphylococcus sp. FDAARGOS_39]